MTGWRPPCAEAQSSLFDLAPGGACRASRVAARAVRSYRTLSPLLRKRSGLLSVALSLKRLAPPRRALPGTVPSWSPDFPRPVILRKEYRAAIIRPSDTASLAKRMPSRNESPRKVYAAGAPPRRAGHRAAISRAISKSRMTGTPASDDGRNRRRKAVRVA